MKISSIAVFLLLLSSSALADVTGTWSGDVELANGQLLPFTAVLVQDGGSVSGVLKGINGAPDVTITGGRIEDNFVTFSGVRIIQDSEVSFRYYGVRAGNDLLFTIYRVGAQGPNALLSTMTRRVE